MSNWIPDWLARQYILENTLYMLLAVSMAWLIAWLWKLNRDPEYRNFRLIDLITTRQGYISRPAFMETGAFLMLTFAFAVMLVRGTPPEWFVGLYGLLFIGRAAHSAYMRNKFDSTTKEGK